jgi:DNA polymerase I
MALPTFRLYEQKVASETTKHGREIIEETKRIVEDEGYEVIYGDTDSVFVSGIPDNGTARRLESNINNSYDNFANTIGLPSHILRIEFEAFATRTIMVAKKRYAMKLDDGSYKIAGFQMKRSDTPPLAREMQEKIIHMILDGAKLKEAYDYYYDMQADIKRGVYNESIGMPRKFTKKLDQYQRNYAVSGAEYSNEYLGKHIGAGDKCIIYHIKNHKDTNSIALESGDPIPKGYIVDTKKHWERINKSLDKLLGDFLPKDKQQSLAAFL